MTFGRAVTWAMSAPEILIIGVVLAVLVALVALVVLIVHRAAKRHRG